MLKIPQLSGPRITNGNDNFSLAASKEKRFYINDKCLIPDVISFIVTAGSFPHER